MKRTFADIRPDLAKYYKPELNDGKLMSDFSRASNKTIILCCDICNTRKKQMPHQFRNGARFVCKYCNSLAVYYPKLAQEFNEEKNNMTAYEAPKSGNTKVWWKCKEGHEWQTTLAHRTYLKTDCPFCNESKGEKIIREWLSANNIKFTSQLYVRINNKAAYYDFYIPVLRLFVEVHGEQHFKECNFFHRKGDFKKQQLIDAEKQSYAEANGRYMMVDYREHDPKLAFDRFIEQLEKMI